MQKLLRRLCGLVVLLAIAFPLSVRALQVPPVPTDVPIVDQANILTGDQKADLAAMIAQERSASGNQIGVLVLKSLEGVSLEEYSLEVARKWGIGEDSRNNGVLLLIALEDRQLRIEVGYGLEGALTDARSNQIIRNDIAPLFRQEKYYEGIKVGVDGIIKSIHNEYQATNPPSNKKSGFNLELIFWAIIILPIWISSILARTKSWWAGGVLGGAAGTIIGFIFGFIAIGLISILGLVALGLLFDWLVSRNFQSRRASGASPSWWAGGTHFGGSGGSGGFGGFGGGSFGGGGSSGGW